MRKQLYIIKTASPGLGNKNKSRQNRFYYRLPTVSFTLQCLFFLLISGASLLPAQGTTFDPSKDGWYFENFSTPSDSLSWEKYKRTYLAINPKHDCLVAPLDCAFYEVFQNSSGGGNCGGIALLGLALFKYGGYMGFCSPANFYSGTSQPDDNDLYDAINIMQARQFSYTGISNILDLSEAGNLNNAALAFKHVKEALARGDYPMISIAKDYVGKDAHTIIAYGVEEPSSGGYPKTILLWDSNHPYDDDSTFYNGPKRKNILRVWAAYDWEYDPVPKDLKKRYRCSNSDGGWCFCVPMSTILEKSRHPFNLDVIQTRIRSLVVSGKASAVSQISDDRGHRYYKTETDEHIYRNELENDSQKKLSGIVRWPWFDQGYIRQIQEQGTYLSDRNKKRPELYFMRSSMSKSSELKVTISGKKYEALFVGEKNLIRINCQASIHARDVIKFSNVATAAQSLKIETRGVQRIFNIQQLRTDATGKEWRSIDVKNLKITRDAPVAVSIVGNFEEIRVSSLNKTVDFNLDIQQRLDGKVTTRKVGKLSTTPGEQLRVAPTNWRMLEKTELKKDLRPQMKIRK